MRILLVGGMGYIGSSVASLLSLRGHEVVMVGRWSPIDESRWGQIVVWNANQEWKNPIPTVDVVVHLASANGDHTLSTLDTYLNNLAVTRNVLELCGRIKNAAVMYVSTLQVFGRWYGELTVDSMATPVSEYGFSHWVAEEQVKMFARINSRKSLILRLSNVCGVGAAPQTVRWGTVPAEFCLQAVRKRSITVHSNRSTQRDFITIERVATQICDLIENKDSWDGKVALVGSGVSSTIGDIADLVSEIAQQLIGVPVPIHFESASETREIEPRLQVICETPGSSDSTVAGESVVGQLRVAIRNLILLAIERDE